MVSLIVLGVKILVKLIKIDIIMAKWGHPGFLEDLLSGDLTEPTEVTEAE